MTALGVTFMDKSGQQLLLLVRMLRNLYCVMDLNKNNFESHSQVSAAGTCLGCFLVGLSLFLLVFSRENPFLLNCIFIVSVEYFLKGWSFNYAGSSNMDQDHSDFCACWCTVISIIPRTVFSSLCYIPKEKQKVEKNILFAFISYFHIFVHGLPITTSVEVLWSLILIKSKPVYYHYLWLYSTR